MNSSYIKAALSHYFRFKNRSDYMATEVGRYNSDFMVIRNNQVCEIEIKISKADLNSERKKPKHKIYEAANSYWTPNNFYFAVPESMVEYTVAKYIDSKYGVMAIQESTGVKKTKMYSMSEEGMQRKIKWFLNKYDDAILIGTEETSKGFCAIMEWEQHLPWCDRVKVVKRAKAIHTRTPDQRVIDTVVKRLMSEMAVLRSNEHLLKEKLSNVKTIQDSNCT